jgi:hypothetical protein
MSALPSSGAGSAGRAAPARATATASYVRRKRTVALLAAVIDARRFGIRAIGDSREQTGQPHGRPMLLDQPGDGVEPAPAARIAGDAEELVVKSVGVPKLAKAIMVLGRNPAISAQSFAEGWRKRSESLEQFQGLSSGVNTFVVHHERRPGEVISHSELPVDAVCEMWFSDDGALRRAFTGEVPNLFAVDKEALIADVSCYAMKTFVIVS